MYKSLRTFVISFMILLLSQIQACSSPEKIEIIDARVRTPTSVTKALGGFMIVKNNTQNLISLVDVKAEGFKQVMLHETINKDGMHRMEHREKILIPAKGKVIFQHGSYHIMFMGLLKEFKSGGKIPVTLIFSDGQEKRVQFIVKDSV